jgi:transcriptional antiterminator RfaH
MENTPNIARWYVIHTKPKQEDRAGRNLKAWGIETFYPRIRKRAYNPFSGLQSLVARPLFPRYLFAKFSARELIHSVSFTRGVEGVVDFGNGPSVVEEEIISLLKSQMGEDGFIKIGEVFKSGDRVRILGGPLRSFDGIFERDLRDSDRVSILLTTISYQARIVVDRELVQRVA